MTKNLALIASLALSYPSCSSDGAGAADPAPDAAPAPLVDAAAAPPDAALDLRCDDLDGIIQISAQIAANAGATRGRYPLVLGHGFFGFDQVGPLEYFNGAAEHLRAQGFAAYVTAVEPIASSETTRGPELGRQIACIAQWSGADKVNLVGHSQGGLDARVVAAASSPFSAYVASVTTVATPHHGTLIADAGLGLVPGLDGPLLDAVAELWGSVVGAPEQDAELAASMEQLSVAYSPTFNAAYPDNPALPYFSWIGRSVRSVLSFDYADAECAGAVLPNPDARDVIDVSLALTFELLSFGSGPNDGLVPVESAKRGTFMSCVAADHSDQIGLLAIPETNPFSGFNHKTFFLTLAGDLEGRGY